MDEPNHTIEPFTGQPLTRRWGGTIDVEASRFLQEVAGLRGYYARRQNGYLTIYDPQGGKRHFARTADGPPLGWAAASINIIRWTLREVVLRTAGGEALHSSRTTDGFWHVGVEEGTHRIVASFFRNPTRGGRSIPEAERMEVVTVEEKGA